MDAYYFMLGLIAGYVFIFFYELCFNAIHKRKGKMPIVRFKGYHLHHSLYGVALLAIFVFMTNLFILGAGIGIIVRHTYAEKKLTFIDKS